MSAEERVSDAGDAILFESRLNDASENSCINVIGQLSSQL
jgi:hypothetical protein